MEKIALNEKYLLSVPEASEYFGIGIKSMRRIAEGNEGSFTVRLGGKYQKTGVTYVYESESYWDKEKQQPRAHRRLIGKLDEDENETSSCNEAQAKRNRDNIKRI